MISYWCFVAICHLPHQIHKYAFFTGENSDINQNLTLLQTAKKRRDILQSRKAIMKIIRQDRNVEKAARNRQCKSLVNFNSHIETRDSLLFIYLFVYQNI